jgi:hypothetical protein
VTGRKQEVVSEDLQTLEVKLWRGHEILRRGDRIRLRATAVRPVGWSCKTVGLIDPGGLDVLAISEYFERLRTCTGHIYLNQKLCSRLHQVPDGIHIFQLNLASFLLLSCCRSLTGSARLSRVS